MEDRLKHISWVTKFCDNVRDDECGLNIEKRLVRSEEYQRDTSGEKWHDVSQVGPNIFYHYSLTRENLRERQ